ncbi:MAG TPA: hypothetical protein VHT91_36245 [Kofleriaceae bacterium]|jgi:hypothetical protein|nr:hypothetical protein [Kofleriaceae bacterium]
MQPIRQGTSHIVPVVVAAGLAVGVFCGLLFGLGTKHEAAAPSRGGTGAKQSEESQIQAAQVSTGTKLPDRPRAATGSAAVPAGSAAVPAGSAAGGAVAAGAAGTGTAAAPGPGKLKVEIEPASAAQAAKVLVDGIQITGTEVDIPFDPGVAKKSVKVVVRVPGYKDLEKSIEVESDGSASISFDLKGVRMVPGSDDGSKAAGGNAGGNTTAGGGAAGAAGTGGTSGGSKNTGTGTSGGGSKSNGSKGTGKGSGKGSSGLIDI